MDDKITYVDAHIEDRELIIKETQNIDVIKDYLGNDFLIGHEENIFHSDNQYLSIPIYNETEKYAILFTSKGGSSLIEGTLDEYNLSVVSEFSDRGWQNTFKSFLTAEKKNPIHKTWKELELISEGKSKKDLIIVTRNPIYKFLSGLFQDLSGEIENSKILYGYIKEKYGLDDSSDSKTIHLPPKALQEASYKYLSSLFRTDFHFNAGHAALYNQCFFLYLTLNNVDKTKLKIIDIDEPSSDLLGLLKQYNPEVLDNPGTNSFWTQRGYHASLLEGFAQECMARKDFHLLESVKRYIKIDFYYYTLLKKLYKENFV